MTEEELAKHDNKTLLQLLLSADTRVDALTAERDGLLRCVTDNHVALCRAEKAEAERDRWQQAFAAQSAKLQIALDVGGEPVRAALKGENHER